MSVVLDQALVATADSIDLLDAMSAVRLHCEAAYDVVNTRAQSSTGYDRTRKFWQGQRKSFAADLLTQMPAVVRCMSARRKQSSVNHPVFRFVPLRESHLPQESELTRSHETSEASTCQLPRLSRAVAEASGQRQSRSSRGRQFNVEGESHRKGLRETARFRTGLTLVFVQLLSQPRDAACKCSPFVSAGSWFLNPSSAPNRNGRAFRRQFRIGADTFLCSARFGTKKPFGSNLDLS